MLHFLHLSVALLTGQVCDTLVLSQTQEVSSKATELTAAICLQYKHGTTILSTRVQSAPEVM